MECRKLFPGFYPGLQTMHASTSCQGLDCPGSSPSSSLRRSRISSITHVGRFLELTKVTCRCLDYNGEAGAAFIIAQRTGKLGDPGACHLRTLLAYLSLLTVLYSGEDVCVTYLNHNNDCTRTQKLSQNYCK